MGASPRRLVIEGERPIDALLRPFHRFFSTAAASGIVLLATSLIAFAWANSPWAAGYASVWETSFSIGVREHALTLSLHAWINDGLMAVFFFLVGLEIKRETRVGELASVRSATLPLAAAIGGMMVPASLYTLVNGGEAGSAGWGVPMATDIAFALGVLALLGDRIPSSLRIFLAAFAIADDLGAVLVVALFYTDAIHAMSLAGAAVVLAMLFGLNRIGVRRSLPYVMLGIVLWLYMLKSGIHTTIAGVLLAFTIPSTMLARLERALHVPVQFFIVPLFALANAGVALTNAQRGLVHPVALGIALGLIVGKPAGITLASAIAIRFGGATLPLGASWRHLVGVALLGGMGFTMSLFIASLAFATGALLPIAKLTIVGASVVAGALGYLALRAAGSGGLPGAMRMIAAPAAARASTPPDAANCRMRA